MGLAGRMKDQAAGLERGAVARGRGRGTEGNKGGEDEGGDGASGDRDRAMAQTICRPAKQTRPETVEGEQAGRRRTAGSRRSAKIGIGGGVLAVLIAGGVVYYRRSLA